MSGAVPSTAQKELQRQVPVPGFDGWVAAAEISEVPWLQALVSSP